MSKSFFIIEKKHIKLDINAIYPFHLYVYNPNTKQSLMFLEANKPLASEKHQFLLEILLKGGKISISQSQKKTFLQDQGQKEEEIPGLNTQTSHPLHDKVFENLKRKKQSLNSKKSVSDLILTQDNAPNAMGFISKAREEIMCLPFTVSHTVSLANYLAENLMDHDSFVNQVVALSYFITKSMGIDEHQALGEIVCAAFFCHLGHTQIDTNISRLPESDFTITQKGELKKHPGLTQHLLRKSEVLISERCNKIMYQHHERYDGNGFPEYKKATFIDPLALALSASTHILEYGHGLIHKGPMPLGKVINAIKNKESLPGLIIDFGPALTDAISFMMKPKVVEKEQAV